MTKITAQPQPAGHLVPMDAPSRSWFGGDPELPSAIPWPSREGRPLNFLLRLSLPELKKAQAFDWLPSHGALLFFYQREDQPWGFDPADRGSWAVLHVADEAGDTTEPPDATEYDLARKFVRIDAIECMPSTERAFGADEPYDEAKFERYDARRRAAFGGLPMHQIGGWPSPQQSDEMELECQLAANGVYCGDATAQSDPRHTALAQGAGDWRLLFQMDTDDDLGVMWGDCGLIYFWVREPDARAGKFDNCWLVLQCG